MALESLSAVFLAYNEEANVKRCLDEARAALDAAGIRDWEIVLVDDGSTDMTYTIASRVATRDPRVRAVRHHVNKGYGEAMRTALRSGRKEWIFLCDADLQFDVADLGLLLARACSSDIVQGFRVGRADPWTRLVVGRAFQLFARGVFRAPVRDPECAFRLVRGSIARTTPVRSRGDLVPLEMLCRAAREGARISEVGIPHHPRVAGHSKAIRPRELVRLVPDSLRLLASLLR